MDHFCQYHNVDQEGLLLSSPPFTETRLAIYTRRPQVKNATGRVFLIAGLAKPRRYFLWETFEIETVKQRRDGSFVAEGPGWQLAPPAELAGPEFEAFRVACANFVGFRKINDLPYARTLGDLAERFRPPGELSQVSTFLDALEAMCPFRKSLPV